MKMTCRLCCKSFELSPDGYPPPWCPGCGADLKNCSLDSQTAEAPGELSAGDKEEWKERFSLHNLVVGILLFVWGAVVSAAPPQSGGDKVLRSYVRLNAVIDVVQVATLINGAALFLSGVALRRGWRWGYPLAILCGIVLVVAGFTFLAAFYHMPNAGTLEAGVAKVSFVRQNLDMLIGLVDGLGLLWFVTTRVPRYANAASAPTK